MLRLLLAFLWLFYGVNEVFAQPGTTSDGRFGTRCHKADDFTPEICSISFYRLLANPERYHHKYVKVTGFVASYLGHLVVFPNKQSYESRISEDGIILNAEIPKGAHFRGDLKQGDARQAIVIGEFDARCSGGMVEFSGCFDKIWNIVGQY